MYEYVGAGTKGGRGELDAPAATPTNSPLPGDVISDSTDPLLFYVNKDTT